MATDLGASLGSCLAGVAGAGATMIYLCGFGVSNYYNKLKFVLLEKQIEFEDAAYLA